MSPRTKYALGMFLSAARTGMEVSIGAGISNFSAWLFETRGLGLKIPCEMVEMRNRYGKKCRVGKFSLTEADRAKVLAWLSQK